MSPTTPTIVIGVRSPSMLPYSITLPIATLLRELLLRERLVDHRDLRRALTISVGEQASADERNVDAP